MNSFKRPVIDELRRKYPNLIRLANRMQDVNDENSYNPTHPATLKNIITSTHPAGELMKLAIQIAIEKCEYMGTLKVLSGDEWKNMGKVCKDISRTAKRVSVDILSLGNKWALREFIVNRCPHIQVM